MKRSKHTKYIYDKSIIYEYKEKYYVMELCQQGKELNPAHGSRQFLSDIAFLSTTLENTASPLEIGQAVFKALDDFDTRGHPYDKFDDSGRNKYIAKLVGARGLPSLERDSRQVVVTRYLDEPRILVYPTDNNHINPWIETTTPVELPIDASPEKLGQCVIQAFEQSTWSPNRKV